MQACGASGGSRRTRTARVIDGMGSGDPAARDSAKVLGAVVKRLAPRWFVLRDEIGQ